MGEKSQSALWRRLDRPGHDAALLRPRSDEWLLRGTAAFGHETGPVSVAYEVEVDRQWRTKRGVVRDLSVSGDLTMRFCAATRVGA